MILHLELDDALSRIHPLAHSELIVQSAQRYLCSLQCLGSAPICKELMDMYTDRCPYF